MESPLRWYEWDTRFIAAHHQPAVLLDLALSRGIDSHALLRGSGLFYEDVASGRARVSPEQLLTLIGNTERLLGAADSSFLFGQRLLPGHYGDVSLALANAGNLEQALERLSQFRALLCPLLAPRLLLDEQQLHIYWLDNGSAGRHQRFLIEAHLTAIVALCKRGSGLRLPWRFQFAYPQPRHVEQYWVHLGDALQFDRHLTLLSLPREYLHQPWLDASATVGQVAQQASQQQIDALEGPCAFLDAFYQYLHDNIREPLNLERVALAFAMSPATLKRKLAKHGTHFQEQLDLVRTHVALYLYQARGLGNEAVARHLGFNDTTNFRRAFKRWTGVVPSGLQPLFDAP
ncbi:AraC family transcriptional regulator [Stutzerimonas kunmingensis]|uniref:AraC family transcriptional regulator n=1 Tax=Stutzerimonas kunmingensis TaxID=1211807 RepID=UPI0028ADA203|nr:AraC family transcriptional regulator ligand-binding domain-containing protein [Stutzerimonas kunmingensis]